MSRKREWRSVGFVFISFAHHLLCAYFLPVTVLTFIMLFSPPDLSEPVAIIISILQID